MSRRRQSILMMILTIASHQCYGRHFRRDKSWSVKAFGWNTKPKRPKVCNPFPNRCWTSLTCNVGNKISSTFDMTQIPEKRSRKTRYTIDDSVCLPTNVHVLKSVVQKACRSLPRYLQNKPIADHTRQAFESLIQQLLTDLSAEKNDDNVGLGLPEVILATFPAGMILDSGCGTGRSTRLLAQVYPQHLVLGIDRSIARLTKSQTNQRKHDDNYIDNQIYVHPVTPNAYLIRAELVDFWRCCLDHDARFWTSHISHHYLLYPNPYPTLQRLTLRWYAHPSFPLLLQLNAQKLIVRSNWEGYLKEFSMAVEMASDYYDTRDKPPTLPTSSSTTNTIKHRNNNENNNNPALPYVSSAKRGPREYLVPSIPWTNFEAKYDNVGEQTYELNLHRWEEIS
jgi:tRNA G46 methylase TrmB